MRARAYLERKAAPHTPVTRNAMLQAFEEGWSLVGSASDPNALDVRRMKLAECVCIVTAADMTNSEQIGRMAVHMLRIIEQG